MNKVEESALNKSLERLLKDGVIECEYDHDKGEWRYWLTPKGEEIAKDNRRKGLIY